MNQHQRYIKFQQEDGFVMEYMGWLGHYEFGLNHKHFDFSTKQSLEGLDASSIDYWLQIWIDYYSYITDLPDDKNLILVNYKLLLNDPEGVIKAIGNKVNRTLKINTINRFDNAKSIVFNGDNNLKAKAYSIHQKLQERKSNFEF